MSKCFKRFKRISAWLLISAIIILLLPPVKALQADYTVLDVELKELDFSNPELITGSAGAVGAVYLYDHVIEIDGIVVDAVVKIVSKSSASASLALYSFDSEGSGQNPKRFEPIINSPDGGGSFTFEVSFWKSNTYGTADPVPVYLKGFALTGVDIDGGLEHQSISGYAYYVKDSTSGLTITQSGEYTNFSAISGNLDGVQFDDTAAYIAYYTLPVTSLTIILGNTGRATGPNRQFSLNIGNIIGVFTDPVIVQNPSKPTLSVQITDDNGVLDNRSNDLAKVTVSGSTDAGIGQTVLLSVTDGTNTVTGSTVVQTDGTYSTVMDFSSLTPGTVTATANVVSSGGTPADSATDTTVIVLFYTVRFEGNGGSSVDDQTVKYNDKVDRPDDPTKSGFDFGGWYLNSDLTAEYSFSAAVTSDLTLYAKWTASNNSPVAVNDTATVDEDSSDNIIAVLTNDTDPDGDTLKVEAVGTASHGTVTLIDGVITYTPDPDFSGEDSFTYTISDGNGDTGTATVNVTVRPVNDAPVAVDDAITVDEDSSNNIITVLTNDTDPDGDTLTVTGVSGPAHGTVVLNPDGTITYTPDHGFTGIDTFYYFISDGKGGTDSATVKVTVNGPVDLADLAIAIQTSSMKVIEGNMATLTITYVNKTFVSADDVYVTASIPPTMSVVSVGNGGIISGNSIIWPLGTLSGGETGTLTFTVKANAINAAEAYAAFTATITSQKTVLKNPEDDTSTIKLLIYSASAGYDHGHEHGHTRYIKGFPDGEVKPYNSITRAEVAAIFARLMDLKGTVNHMSIYSDVNTGFWAADYIEAVSKAGIFKGYADGTFKPNQPITRAELAAVIARYLGIAREQNQYQYLRLSGFTDTYDSWAAQTIEELFRYCVVSGYTDGTFKPNQNITRAEAVTMINRMLYRGPLTGVEPSFPDNKVGKWYFGDIEEATRTHYYVLNPDGTETMTVFIEEDLW